MSTHPQEDAALQSLLDAIYRRYQHDFRSYSQASMKRRVHVALQRMGAQDLADLEQTVLSDSTAFSQLLSLITIPVSDMFRDATYFSALRRHVLPVLSTYPSPKIWVAGCSTGEEVYSISILLEEQGLLDRTVLYATDINPISLRRAETGVFASDRVRTFTQNYRAAGGTRSFAEYYRAAHGAAVFDRRLRKNVVFTDHSLATDSVFAEVQLVSCRNVLIYFNRDLQDRALGLFADALCLRGFLGLGSKESLRLSAHAARFEEFDGEARIYRRAH